MRLPKGRRCGAQGRMPGLGLVNPVSQGVELHQAGMGCTLSLRKRMTVSESKV